MDGLLEELDFRQRLGHLVRLTALAEMTSRTIPISKSQDNLIAVLSELILLLGLCNFFITGTLIRKTIELSCFQVSLKLLEGLDVSAERNRSRYRRLIHSFSRDRSARRTH